MLKILADQQLIAPQPVACATCLSRSLPCHHLHLDATAGEQTAWLHGYAAAMTELERRVPVPRIVSATARCRSCGAYTDDIQFEYSPPTETQRQTVVEADVRLDR